MMRLRATWNRIEQESEVLNGQGNMGKQTRSSTMLHGFMWRRESRRKIGLIDNLAESARHARTGTRASSQRSAGFELVFRNVTMPCLRRARGSERT